MKISGIRILHGRRREQEMRFSKRPTTSAQLSTLHAPSSSTNQQMAHCSRLLLYVFGECVDDIYIQVSDGSIAAASFIVQQSHRVYLIYEAICTKQILLSITWGMTDLVEACDFYKRKRFTAVSLVQLITLLATKPTQMADLYSNKGFHHNQCLQCINYSVLAVSRVAGRIETICLKGCGSLFRSKSTVYILKHFESLTCPSSIYISSDERQATHTIQI